MTKSLDLGCGDQPRNPFHADEVYGVDVREGLAGRIRCADLVVEPIPFADASFDYVTAHDFIEHLPRILYAPERHHPFVDVINEVHRVLKPGGLFFSFTPAYPHTEAFRDPTHVNIITFDTFPVYFADPEPYGVIYGFKGAFEVGMNVWQGKHVATVLRKFDSPRLPAAPSTTGSRVTVLLPLRGEPAAVLATLDALLAQSHADLEVIVLGDAMPPRADPRLRLVSTPPKQPLPRVLDNALAEVGGDHVLIVDPGDRPAPGRLAQLVARAREARADAVIGTTIEQAPCSGREACERLGAESELQGVLWKTTLLRAIGIEEFSADATRYAACRLLLGCRRVAWAGGGLDPAARVQDPYAFDAPYTDLRLAQLFQEHGLSRPLVRAQKARAIAAAESLRQRLKQAEAAPNGFDATSARLALERFDHRLGLLHVFDPRPGPTPRERLRRLKRTLRGQMESLRSAIDRH